MNESLRRIVEQVEHLDPVVQEAIVREFQRVVTVVAAVVPDNPLPWDERFERFTLRARVVVRLAQEEAQRLHDPAIGTEHLLFALIRDGEGVAARVLQRLDVDDPERVLRALRAGAGGTARGAEPYAGDLPWTAHAAAVFALAAGEARDLGAGHIGTEHLLLGLLRERDSVGTRVLISLGVNLDEARRVTFRLIGKGD